MMEGEYLRRVIQQGDVRHGLQPDQDDGRPADVMADEGPPPPERDHDDGDDEGGVFSSIRLLPDLGSSGA